MPGAIYFLLHPFLIHPHTLRPFIPYTPLPIVLSSYRLHLSLAFCLSKLEMAWTGPFFPQFLIFPPICFPNLFYIFFFFSLPFASFYFPLSVSYFKQIYIRVIATFYAYSTVILSFLPFAWRFWVVQTCCIKPLPFCHLFTRAFLSYPFIPLTAYTTRRCVLSAFISAPKVDTSLHFQFLLLFYHLPRVTCSHILLL